jgi:hypothetical protein
MKQNRKQKEKNQNKKKKNLSHLGRPEAAAQQHPGSPLSALLSFSFSFHADRWDPPVSIITSTVSPFLSGNGTRRSYSHAITAH